jgi:molybdenum cofactor cytidylyltransferase
MKNTAVIILAAGNSSRLGTPKQLIPFNHKTLLRHVIDEAIEAAAEYVIVITGANADGILQDIDQDYLHIVFNKDWETGMVSGIVAGVNKAVALNSAIDKIIITVCDQPFVTADLFRQLYIKQDETKQPIVACAYADTIGIPVLFTNKYFDDLLSLKGHEGAKRILKLYPEDVVTVMFPQGNIDIDTKDDYDDLIKNQTTFHG